MGEEAKEVTTEQRMAQLELLANGAAIVAAKTNRKALIIVCGLSTIFIIGTVIYYQSRIEKLEEEIRKLSQAGSKESDQKVV